MPSPVLRRLAGGALAALLLGVFFVARRRHRLAPAAGPWQPLDN